MIVREDDGYIKLYYFLNDGDGNLFEEAKKESALIGKMNGGKPLASATEGQAPSMIDVFDEIVITDDDALPFDSALYDCFYSISEAFKKYGLDYKNLSKGLTSMVQRETIDEKQVYAIYFTDRGSVSTATLSLLDDLLFRYIIYTLVHYTAKYMNNNQYLDLSDKMISRLLPIEDLIYQATMEAPRQTKRFVYYGVLPIGITLSGAVIDSDEYRTVELLKSIPSIINYEVPDGYYFYIAFPAEWGQYNFVSYTGREVVGTFFSDETAVKIPSATVSGYEEQICTVVKTDWSGVNVENFTFKRI